MAGASVGCESPAQPGVAAPEPVAEKADTEKACRLAVRAWRANSAAIATAEGGEDPALRDVADDAAREFYEQASQATDELAASANAWWIPAAQLAANVDRPSKPMYPDALDDAKAAADGIQSYCMEAWGIDVRGTGS